MKFPYSTVDMQTVETMHSVNLWSFLKSMTFVGGSNFLTSTTRRADQSCESPRPLLSKSAVCS